MKMLFFFCRLALFLMLLFSGTLANAKSPHKKLSTVFIDHAVQGINPSISSTNNVLQLFTHGRPGELFINNEWKSKEAIAVWLKENYALANYNHINIYGCEFAKGEKGLAAVKYLEQHLAVAIAASTNITGKDGDWKMEIGKEINVISLPGFQYNLQCSAAPTVTVLPNTDCINHNGRITVTNALTPAADYEYSKDGGVIWQTSNVFNNLSGGAYNIRYRNINAATSGAPCFSSVLQSTVNTTAVIPATPAGTPAVSACNASTGQISLNTYTATSGSTNFQFSIDGNTWITANGTGSVPYGVIFTNLAPGTYNIRARNISTGCVSANSAAIVVGTGAAVTTATGTAMAATSCSPANGSVSLGAYTPTNNNSNFEFSINGSTWITSNGTSSPPYGVVFNNLAPGTYNIVARNKTTGCSSANSANITVAAPVVATPAGTATATSNCASATGQISLSTYTNAISNTNFEFSVDGTTWITANGTATAPYGVVFNNLAAGTYNIVARNKTTGCSSANSANIIVTNPAIATPTTTNVANTNCSTTPNGRITITNTTYLPIANYSFSINNGTTWQTGTGMNVFNNLAQGNYNVAVRNNITGCISIRLIVNLTNTAAIPATPAGTPAASACNASTGQVLLSNYVATNGNSNFQFSIDGNTWITANGTGSAPYGVIFTNLAPGTYNIRARNISTGCVSANSTAIVVGTGAAVTTATGTAMAATSCSSPNGSILLGAYVPTNNNSNFEFSINGSTWITANGTGTPPYGVVFNNLAPGTYNIVARNKTTGCSSANSTNIIVNGPAAVATPTGTAMAATSCSPANGSVSLGTYVPTNNNSNFEFSINGSTWITSNGTGSAPYGVVFNNLASGAYNIVARNKTTGCSSANSTNIIVNGPAAVTTPTGTAIAATSCSSPNGFISLGTYVSTNNNSNFEFSINGSTWITSNGTGSAPYGVVFNNLTPGTYNMVARNKTTGCTSANSANITIATATVPATPTVTAVNSTNCLANNGTITVTAPTPLSDHQFSIDNGVTWQVSPNFTGLAPYTGYRVVVKNIATSCNSAANPITISGPAAVAAPVLTATNVTDCNAGNGSIVFTAPADGISYSFTIDYNRNFSSNPSFRNLNSRTYYCAIRNNNSGCISAITPTQAIKLTNGTPTITTTNSNATSCFPNGSITVTAPASGSGYLYSKDAGATYQSSNVFSNLDAGTYEIMAKGITTGCETTLSRQTITNAAAIASPTVAKNPQTCSGLGSITFTAPTPLNYYEYSIDGGNTFSSNHIFTNLATGTYPVAIRSLTSGCVSQIQNVVVADTRSAANCTDTDGDGHPNEADIDDDNDGILDINEYIPPSCNGVSPYSIASTDNANNKIILKDGSNIDQLEVVITPMSKGTSFLFDLPNSGNEVRGLTLVENTSQILNYNLKKINSAGFIQAIFQPRSDSFATQTNFTSFKLSYDATRYTAKLINESIDIIGLAVGDALISGQEYSIPGASLITTNPFTLQISSIGVLNPGDMTNIVWSQYLNDPQSLESFSMTIAGCGIGPPLDTDADGIPNTFDLDSDGDGCPDAIEGAASFTTADLHSSSIAGGNSGAGYNGTSTMPVTQNLGNTVNGSGVPAAAGASGQTKGTSWDKQLNECTDSDADGIVDLIDLDDDNDGILDKVECPDLFTNMAGSGGFSPAATAIANWYTGLTASPLPVQSPFTPSAYSMPKSGVLYNYGGQPVYSGNSTITGGLFDIVDGVNTTGGLEYALQEADPQRPIVCQLTSPLVAGQEYLAAFDLGSRTDGPNPTTKYVVLLYNATNNTTEEIIATDLVASLPGPSISPAYKTINTSFIPNSSASYYLLFYPSTGGGVPDDFTIDRVAVVASASGLCDVDADGAPNYLDLDSDGDGCSDAFETGVTGTLIKGMLVNKSGITNSNNAVAQGGYGANGFANALETVVESGTYTGSYTNYTNATNGVLSSGCIILPQTKPDVNNSYVGVAVTGNVSTNDSVPVGSTYSNLTLLPGYTNPAGDLPVLTGTDGTYTFTATTTPGIYKFLVTVCPPSLTVGCPMEELAITVLDRNAQTNPPSATVDFAITKMNVPVTLPTMQNDRSGNSTTTLNPATVSITASPKHGTASVNTTNGNITYTPAQGFIGIDTLTYIVCDNASPTINCATALQIITVLPTSATNSMQTTDDYNTTLFNTPITGLVLVNDIDPESNNKRALVQNTTVSGKGTLILNMDGSYTFTPVNDFTGPVDFPYTACDDGSPVACRKATLHILVAGYVSALPIKLISFHGYNKRNGNMLEWKTSSEINSSYFDILYSHSGQNFVKIGTLSTAGNSSAELAYNYLHAQAQAGNNFYQLVSVDVDGKKEYSSIINIRMNANSKLTVSPVPAKNEVTIKAPKEELLTLKLYSITGQDVTAMVRIVKLSETVSMIYINQLPSDVYYLKTKTQSTKIIKQ